MLKEQEMKTFKDLKLGTFFTAKGKDWYKFSNHAAYNPWGGETLRFKKDAPVRMITQNVRHAWQ